MLNSKKTIRAFQTRRKQESHPAVRSAFAAPNERRVGGIGEKKTHYIL